MISSPRARGCKYRSRVRGPSLRSLVFRSNQSRALLRSFVWRFLPAELNEFHLCKQSRPLPLQLAHSLRRCVSHCSPVQVERIVLAAPSLAIQDNYMQWSWRTDQGGVQWRGRAAAMQREGALLRNPVRPPPFHPSSARSVVPSAQVRVERSR